MSRYRICGLTIEMNAPEWTLHDNLKIFLCDAEDTPDPVAHVDAAVSAITVDTVVTDICCSIVFKMRDAITPNKTKLIVRTAGTSIYESDGYIYNLSSYEKEILYCLTALENWSVCTMYVDQEYNDKHNKEMVQRVKNSVLAALRKVMIAALAQKQGLLIHSASVLWNNKGIVFSAPSQTGKSTHAHLWKQLYGTPILDGDVTACRIVNGIPLVYGLPWCGTSGEFMNQSVPLGAIVFLQQAKENRIEKLDFKESFLRLAARCFLLPWNDEMTNQFLNIIQEVAASAGCYLLNCLPDNDAVELVKKCLEKN